VSGDVLVREGDDTAALERALDPFAFRYRKRQAKDDKRERPIEFSSVADTPSALVTFVV
jgi:hypothetical protein